MGGNTQEQGPVEGAKGGQPLEPSLHRLRGSLVGTRFELLKLAAFSLVFSLSVCMIASGAGLLSPKNQFYANAREAAYGLGGSATVEAASLGNQVQTAAASAENSLTSQVSRVTAAIPSSLPAMAPSARIEKVPAHPAAKHHLAKAVASLHHRFAHHRHHPVHAAVPATAAAANMHQAASSLASVPDQMNDEFSKAYYSGLRFFGAAFVSSANSARGALDSFARLLGLNPEFANVDSSRPETVFEVMTSTSTLIMLLGMVLFVFVAGVFAMSVKDSLRDASRRLRTKRGYA